MKRFLLKMTVVLLPVLLTILPVFAYMYLCPMRYMDGEWPYWKEQMHYVRSYGNDCDVISIGDSTMNAGIRPLLVDNVKVHNLGLGGSTAVEGYYTLKAYLAHHRKPKAVVIGYYMTHYIESECSTTRTLYFNFLTPLEIKEVREYARRLNDPWWNAPGISKTIRQYVLRLPNAYAIALKNSIGGKRYRKNKEIYKKKTQEKGYMFFGTDKGYYGNDRTPMTYWKDFSPNALTDIYLHRTLNLCKEKGIPLLLVQIPHLQSSAQYMDNLVRCKIEAYFMSLQKEYPSLDIETNIRWFDNSLFGDGAHLGTNGAEEFTALVMERLKEKGYVKQ